MTSADEKAARLAAALRANLARRKDQARARKAEGGAAPKPAAEQDTASGLVLRDVIVSKDEAG